MRPILILSALILIASLPTAAAWTPKPLDADFGDARPVPAGEVTICEALENVPIICDVICDPPEGTYGDFPVTYDGTYGVGIGGPSGNGGHDGAFGPYTYIGCS